MFARDLEAELKQMALNYPVVTLLGPRQSGKTTLVQHVFTDKPYANLEAMDVQELAKADPRQFLAQFPQGAILDEIQRVPELLSYIQVIVDKEKKKGMFILTGSHQMELHEAVAQSLAGRTVLLTLLPLSLRELTKANISQSLDEALLFGGFPRIFQDGLEPTKAYRNYLQTYIERDVRKLINLKDLAKFQQFMRLCAGRVGQLINLSSLASDVGVSAPTIQHWLTILEASFIVIRLQPYFENFGKRIVKSPKLFFTDVGLATYLLSIESIAQVARDPLRGNLVENLVLLELMKARFNEGKDPQLYFFRDTHGHEVDFIFQSGNSLVPIEVKAAQTFNATFLKNITFFKSLVENRCTQGYLIYSGSTEQNIGDFRLLHFSHATQALD